MRGKMLLWGKLQELSRGCEGLSPFYFEEKLELRTFLTNKQTVSMT